MICNLIYIDTIDTHIHYWRVVPWYYHYDTQFNIYIYIYTIYMLHVWNLYVHEAKKCIPYIWDTYL